MLRDPKFVRKIDDSEGLPRCKDCGTPLQSVALYESPKGRKSEIRGYCPNEKCAFHMTPQSDG